MNSLAQLLEANNCSDELFYNCLHQTMLIFVLEDLCKVMKNDPETRTDIMKEYYRIKDNIKATDKIVRSYCGTRLPEEDLQWINKCLLANLKKRAKRVIVSDQKKEVLLISQQYKCACCGDTINLKNSHYDHIVPWDFVGDELENNYQMLCSYCNEHKSASTYYMLKRQIIPKNI